MVNKTWIIGIIGISILLLIGVIIYSQQPHYASDSYKESHKTECDNNLDYTDSCYKDTLFFCDVTGFYSWTDCKYGCGEGNFSYGTQDRGCLSKQ